MHVIITFRHYSILNYPFDLKDCINSHAFKEQLYADDFWLHRAFLTYRSLSTWGSSQVEQLIMITTDSITFPHTSCSSPHLCQLYERHFLTPPKLFQPGQWCPLSAIVQSLYTYASELPFPHRTHHLLKMKISLLFYFFFLI